MAPKKAYNVHSCPEIRGFEGGFFPREAKGVKYRKSSCVNVYVQVASGHVPDYLHLAMPRPVQSSSSHILYMISLYQTFLSMKCIKCDFVVLC